MNLIERCEKFEIYLDADVGEPTIDRIIAFAREIRASALEEAAELAERQESNTPYKILMLRDKK